VFAPERIVLDAPDLNVPSFAALDFDAMVERALRRAEEDLPAVIAGSSLGAIVALSVSRVVPSPLVLIAPALGFGNRWTEKLPPGDPLRFFHHGENRELPIHRAFFERMAAVDVDRDPPGVAVTILMGRHDESVPIAVAEEVWKRWEQSGKLVRGSRFMEIAEGDHGLTGFVHDIAREIRSAAHGKMRAHS
jgi:pimeloyl-ACP methyl ester carboxylesterase